ncbi:MAG: GYD domain-containing protein [Actinomycetota bacterium]|nr:GYD domain-containing protein [Actinomycetota bacterium]
MPKYLSLFSFKGETLGRLVQTPSDREAVLRELIESAGGSLESYYVMFGQYDGCLILDAPDSMTTAAIAVSVASSGAFAGIETHELMTSAQLLEVLDRAKNLTYRPPGE